MDNCKQLGFREDLLNGKHFRKHQCSFLNMLVRDLRHANMLHFVRWQASFAIACSPAKTLSLREAAAASGSAWRSASPNMAPALLSQAGSRKSWTRQRPPSKLRADVPRRARSMFVTTPQWKPPSRKHATNSARSIS